MCAALIGAEGVCQAATGGGIGWPKVVSGCYFFLHPDEYQKIFHRSKRYRIKYLFRGRRAHKKSNAFIAAGGVHLDGAYTQKGAALDAGIVLILGQDGVTSGRSTPAGAGPGADLLGHAGDLHSPGRVRRLRGAHAGDAAGRQGAGDGVAAGGDGAIVAVVDGLAGLRDRDTEGLGSLLGWNLAYPLALAALLTRWSRAACRWRCRFC